MEEWMLRQVLSELMIGAAYEGFMSGSESSDDDDYSMPGLEYVSQDESWTTDDSASALKEDPPSLSWKAWCVDEAPCPSDLCSGLQRIKISELRLGQRHLGRVLFGTLRDCGTKGSSVQGLLEDEAGNVVKLSIFHVQIVVFRKGMKVAIKYPFLKNCLDGSICLRVDNPGDVVVDDLALEAQDTKGKTPAELLQSVSAEAVSCFVAEQWDRAIQAYSKYISLLESHLGDAESSAAAVESQSAEPVAEKVVKGKGKGRKKKLKAQVVPVESVPDTSSPLYQRATAYSSRAQAWLELHHYQNAISDAVKACGLDPRHQESVLRKGKALLGLQRYQEAVSCLQQSVNLGPNVHQVTSQANELLKEAKTADQQNRFGVYSLDAHYLNGRKGAAPKCSDFVGPLEIKVVQGEQLHIGRGLFLTRDVKEGELLLVGNPMALSSCMPQAVSSESAGVAALSAVTEDLVTQLINSAIRCPKLWAQLDSLQDRSDGTPKNVPPATLFSSPGSTGSVDDFSRVPEEVLDVARIRRVVEINALEVEDIDGTTWQRSGKRTGVWGLPSFINHSCAPNCTWTWVGDTIFVRAFRNLSAGEEINVPYINVFLPVQGRRLLLSKRRFLCCCARCSFEQDVVKQFPMFNRLAAQIVETKAMTRAEISQASKVSKAAKGANNVERIVTKLQATDAAKKDWMRASYSRFYLWKSIQKQQQPKRDWVEDLDLVFGFMTSVYPSEEALGLLGPALHNFPGLSKTWSTRWKGLADKICKCLYGPLQGSTVKALLEKENERFVNGWYTGS